MTQFKDKSSKHANFTVGLLTYPVLMAADILMYDADYVPVGIDQKQHVELTRDIAIRFNKKYGDTFKIPEPLIKETGTKIMDLVNPSIKMSKSAENKKGVIYLLDDLSVIRKKIASATTDSDNKIKFDMENKKGISNLLNIYCALTNKTISEAEEEFKDCNYGAFKTKVADVVCEVVASIQEKYNEYVNSDIIDKILDRDLEKVTSEAKKKYEIVKEKVGFSR